MALKKTLMAAGVVAAIGLGVTAQALAHGSGSPGQNPDCPWQHSGYMGPGMMGQGMGPGYGMMGQGMGPGYGMMGQGMGPGYGMMGQGMGPGYGMGQGMGPGYGMGQGTGPGYGMGQGTGPGYGMRQGTGPDMMAPLREDLSADDVRHMLEHRLAWNGNPNIKVGKVEDADEDTIVAEIVTQDGSLVQKLQVDRHTGWTQPAQ